MKHYIKDSGNHVVKKAVIGLLLAATLLSLSACSGTVNPGDTSSEQTTVSTTEATTVPTTEATTVTTTEATTVTTTEATTTTPKPDVAIRIGQNISLSNCTLKIKSVRFSYEVLPSNISGYYTYYAPDPGKVFIDIYAEVYNTSKTSLQIRDLPEFNGDYNNGYSYNGFCIIEDSDGNNFLTAGSWQACDPLTSCYYHCLISCPSMVETSGALFIFFTDIDGTTYRYTIR